MFTPLLLLVEDKSGSIIFVILVVILKALLYDVLRCRFGTCLLLKCKNEFSVIFLQDPKKDYISDLKCAQQNIVILLRIREDTEYIASWNTFFNSIPVEKSNVHQSYENILLVLATHMEEK